MTTPAPSFIQNRLIGTFVFICVLISNIAFGQSEMNFVRSFYITDQAIVLNLGENTEVKEWDNNSVRVLMTVRFNNKNVTSETIKGIAQIGRYRIATDTLHSTITLSAPETKFILKLNGKRLTDNIHYVVFVPKNTRILRRMEMDTRTVATRH